MSETQALQSVFTELNVQSKWFHELMGQSELKLDMNRDDFAKAEDTLPKSELYAALAISDKFKHRVTYVTGADQWHIWDGRIHLPCEGDVMITAIVREFHSAINSALKIIKQKFEERCNEVRGQQKTKEDISKEVSAIMKEYNTIYREHKSFRDKVTSHATQRAVIAQLKTMMSVPSDYFEDDRDWFVVENCVIDVKASREAKQIVWVNHDPARPVYRYFNANYNPKAEYPALQRFLDNSLADETQAKFFQKALGSVLVGAPTKTKTIIDAYGATDGGKSMINGVINKLGKDFYFEATDHAITKSGKDADMFRDRMRQARIITFLEVKAKLDKTFILKYTGGDTIETTRKYRNSVQWKAQGLIMLMSNEGMNIGSQEEAVADRIERINFPHQFFAEHPDPRYLKDETLQSQIIEQADGFLTWLLEGFVLHLVEDINMDGKIKPSESMALLKAELQDSSNTAAIFWESVAPNKYEQNVSAPESKWVPFITLMADYKTWCKATNHTQMEESDVKAWMKRQGYVRRASSQLRLVERVASPNRFVNY